MTAGRTQVVVFGRLFEGVNPRHVFEDQFDVCIPALNGTRVLVRRDVDYVTNSPVPFAPLTRIGLGWNRRNALNGLDEMEFGTVLEWRRNRS